MYGLDGTLLVDRDKSVIAIIRPIAWSD